MENNLWENIPSPLFVKVFKKWVTKSDSKVSDLCFENKKVWRIEVSEEFPSWHLKTPWHIECRCIMEYVKSVEVPEITKKEKWEIVLRMALELFKRKGRADKNLAKRPTAILSRIMFMFTESQYWSNIKINKEFLKYTENKPETYFRWYQIWWEVLIDWEIVYLSDFWNLLFWYNAWNLNLPYWFSEWGANIVTWEKVEHTWETVEENEKDDRVFYKLWYELAEKYPPEKLTLEALKEYILKWTNEANKIRANK